MTPPLIIDNRGDIMLFREAANAASAIEAFDVMNNEYVGFDAKGCPLIFSAKSPLSRVNIQADESQIDETGAKNALTRLLTSHRVPVDFYRKNPLVT